MDPDFFRNSLSSRYTAQDITSLLSEQAGLSQGLNLGSAFPGASSLSSRSFGPVPGYAGHALHTQSLGENHFSGFPGQNPYKPLQQTTFNDPYASLRLQQSSASAPKSMFQQDSSILKDVSSYATPVPQSNSIDASQKTWGFPNFVASNHNLYTHPSDLPGLDYTSGVSLPSQPILNPPPAHSSKPAPLVQRNMYSSADMFLSRGTKSPPSHSIFEHRSHTVTPSTSHLSLTSHHSLTTQPSLAPSMTSHSNLTSQHSLFPFSQTHMYPVKSEINIFSNSDPMNYEAVSPATPEQHNQGGDSYSSLQDLASISSTQQKLEVNLHQKQASERQIKTHSNHSQKTTGSRNNMRQDIYSGPNSQMSQIKQSPQPSPISVGGSPQMQQIGSPNAPIPSSTVVQAPPPVQAPADSTTKPKKGRVRKKKEPIVSDFKSEPCTPGYSPQTFTSSPDVPPRGNGNDFLTNQQHNYIQASRNQHHPFSSSASLGETGHSSSPLMTSMNQPYGKTQNQSIYVKNENQPNVVNPQQTSSQSRLIGLQSPPSTSQANMSYSISGALEMSREAVFPNHDIMEGYNSHEMSNYNMQESFTNQLVERPIEGIVRQQDVYNSQEDSVYSVANAYGGQFVSPNSVLNMDMGNSQQGSQSTIDEAAFTSLMEDSFRENNGNQDSKRFTKGGMSEGKMPYIPLTATIEAEDDEDLSHLAGAVVDKNESNPANNHPQGNFHLPPPNPRHEIRNASGGGSFMDSFMSFLQGKKPETLSSMSSAIIHTKPQLPKYIPEPRRPRPVEDVANRSSGSQSSSLANSDMAFSESEEEDSDTKNVVQSAISNLGNENDSVKISTNKSGGLTMKINLSKVKKAEEDAKNKSKSKKSPKLVKKVKGGQPVFGLKGSVNNKPKISAADDDMLPLRQLSARKAKENKGKYVDTDSDSDTPKPVKNPTLEIEEAYDSDRDPVWTPVSLDKKQTNFASAEGASRKKRVKRPKSKPTKSRRLSDERRGSQMDDMEVVELYSSTDEEEVAKVPNPKEALKVGDFVIDTKDIKNFESYPIWRIESGRMLHKFELFTENSRILHRAIPTFSSWLPSMQKSLQRIRIVTVFKQGDKEHVEVQEEDRPRPMINRKLEQSYEEHPLVEPFNVYIQTFLSQALEPGFLSAILESSERFYLNALDRIDKALATQISEIDKKVHWTAKFKDVVMTRPHIRELDRPNLKQSCQACEFTSQHAVKSVHLFGNPYNKFSLVEENTSGSNASLEFMIGKTASKYVGPYHAMYHFKYNLFKRCQAKVKIVQETDKKLDNAAILDQCLQNRAWVLQIFEDFKKLLEKG